jgi:MoaA/NifB/PqqE/SkfB family radical SAM enzyme
MKDFKNMSKTYCPLPFVHFALKPNGNAKPCCRFQTFASEESKIRNWNKVNHNSIGSQDVLSSEEFSSVRDSMLKGENVPGCWKCYKEEETSGYSMRTFYNKRFLEHDNSVKLKYLEVSFGNYCNLGCRMCNSGLSTTWHNDDAILSKKYNDRTASKKIIDIPFNWKIEDFQYVEEIKFVGGEPMLNPNFDKFLETVLKTGRSKSIRLTIFTNASWFPKPKIIELLKKFKNVFIWLSIDSFGKTNDYIRHQSKWDTVNEVACKYLDLERDTSVFSVTLTPTLSILNISNVDELVSWWVNARISRNLEFTERDTYDFHSGDIVFSSVYEPESLSVKNIPNKDVLIQKYRSIITTYENNANYEIFKRTYYKVISALERFKDQKENLTEFVEFTKDLDKLRNENFKEIFFELYDIVNNELSKIDTSYENINGRLDG